VKKLKERGICPAEVQQKALDQRWHISLKGVEGTFLNIYLPSDDSSLRIEIRNRKVIFDPREGRTYLSDVS
jgi:hypothetical protein